RMLHGICGLLAGLGMLLAGCDSSTSPGTATAETLVGKWSYTQVIYKYDSKTTPASPDYPDEHMDTTFDFTGKGKYIEFKSDKTYTAVHPDLFFQAAARVSAAKAGIETGTWSMENGIVTTVAEGDTTKGQVNISGSAISILITLEETDKDGDLTTTYNTNITFKGVKQP
ncbi:MAG: hypothetical protein ABI036_07085, partial [Fibrobacteria bacterium]